MKSEDARAYARQRNVKLWEVAAELGISEPTLTRWLRKPLSDEREARFVAAVNTVAARKIREIGGLVGE